MNKKCPKKIKLINDCYGSHNGQIDCRIIALDQGIIRGKIDYAIFEKEVYIDMMETSQEFRRCGIATKMLDKLKKETKSYPMNYGWMTKEGTTFLKTYDLRKINVR